MNTSTRQQSKILIVILANHEGTLPGCENDGARIARCFPDFEVWWCRQATRPAIFELFRRLLRTLQAHTVLVVYFSGHGGRAFFPQGLGLGFPPELDWPFFVTVDQRRGETFNSLLAVELSMLVGRCAEITRNIVVLADTCFAQEMLRGHTRLKSVRRRPFALPTHLVSEHAEFTTFAGWLSSLRSAPRSANLLDDRVVCVSAAGVRQPAYEVEDDRGQPGGAFTLELCMLLERARARRVCWQHLVSVLRERLTARWGAWFQRPEITGPGGRRLFELDSVDVSASTSTFLGANGTHWIRSGRIHGTQTGDVFVAHGVHTFVELEVVEVGEAHARVIHAGHGVELEAGSLVYPHQISRQIPVSVDPDHPRREALLEQLSRSMCLTPCAPGDAPALRVAWHLEGLTIRDASGELERVIHVEKMITALEALARTHTFEGACTRASEPWPGNDWSHRMFHGNAAGERELVEMDQVLVGDRLWLELHNHSHAGVPSLFVSVIERGVDGHLRVLNGPQHPAGVHVPGQSNCRVLWYPEGPHGREQTWPLDVPRSGPRRVIWYLIASPLPLDLRTVATHARRGDPPSGSGDRIASHEPGATTTTNGGRIRGLEAPDVRWTCRRISFLLTFA